MTDRAEELRSSAAQCLALARSTTNSTTRAELITMAQRLYDLANRPPGDFDAIVQGFNDQQINPQSAPTPVMQQQQQPQPKQDGEKD